MTIITIAYNEELMLPYFIRHYRSNFPKCRIIVYDNYSTDNTVNIALEHGCEVISYDTGGKLSDTTYLEIKNNSWKQLEGWVIVCDVDELCDIRSADLFNESKKGTSIIRFEGYNMVNLYDHLRVEDITHGVRSESYDKSYCFDADLIKEINYHAGAHSCAPVGVIKYSGSAHRCRHYKYINIDYMIERHHVFASRLSDENIKKGYGFHYLYSAEKIRNEFIMARKKSTRII